MNQLFSPYSDALHSANHHHAAHLKCCYQRLVFVMGMMALLYMVILGRLVTVAQHDEDAAQRAHSTQAAKPAFGRADIVDRNGVLLASSLKSTSAYAKPRLISQPDEALRKILSVLPELDAVRLAKALKSDKDFIWLKRKITPKEKYALNALGIPGLEFTSEEERLYPHGRLMSHVLGFVNLDQNGAAGVERSLNEELLQSSEPVALSIDVRLQTILRDRLREHMHAYEADGSAGLVMDVRSGEIVAMVSLPDFDPLKPSESLTMNRTNRLTNYLFEMGSTFKSFTTALALEHGKVKLSTHMNVAQPIRFARHTIRDSHPLKRPMSVPEIFIYSSNIGTVRMAEKVGRNEQRRFYDALGLLSPVSVELPERTQPLFPDPWRDIHMMTLSFGHGMAVTPLHVARATAAIIGNGRLPVMSLRKRTSPVPVTSERLVSAKTTNYMRSLLRLAVMKGTGKKAEISGYQIGGKTGTAEKAIGGRYDKARLVSSFVAAFPMEEPRYLTLVMFDEPKKGVHGLPVANAGYTAAPATRDVIARITPLLGMQPMAEPKKWAGEQWILPKDSLGYGEHL